MTYFQKLHFADQERNTHTLDRSPRVVEAVGWVASVEASVAVVAKVLVVEPAPAHVSACMSDVFSLQWRYALLFQLTSRS